VISSLKVIIYW